MQACNAQRAALMACPVLITSVDVLDNPAKFTNPLQFEIQYECILPLNDGACLLLDGQPRAARLQCRALSRVLFQNELRGAAGEHSIARHAMCSSAAADKRVRRALRNQLDSFVAFRCWELDLTCP